MPNELENNNFIRKMTKTPNPYTTDGLYFCKRFVTLEGRYGTKCWIKKIDNQQKIKYSFNAVYLE